MTVGLVVVSSAVIGGDTKDVIGFVALGIIVWTTITSLVTEGASAFSRNAELIINSNIRTDCYIGKALFTTLIIFCHHIILYFLAVVLLLVPLSWTSFLAIPGIVLLFANGYWLVVVLAFLCARFKDIEPIIRSLLQVGFFVTPVFWNPNIIATGKPAFVNYNLLYYFIEIVRSPLLGHVPPLKYYAIVTACTLVGYAIAFLIYRQMRARLAFVV
jgi:ABC-type polysaccharide/polyol phosphate export permease